MIAPDDDNPPFTLKAAYLQHGVRTTDDAPPDAPLVLKDAAHQVVFAAPASRILWIRRQDAVAGGTGR